MATLRQDIWLGPSSLGGSMRGDAPAGETAAVAPRRRGLRLGPYGAARARMLLHPEPGRTLDTPALVGFLERLAREIEVIVLEPRPLESPDALATLDPVALGAWRDEWRQVVDLVGERWGNHRTLTLVGLGAAAGVTLSLADHPAVAALVAVCPLLPATGDDPLATPALAEKPVLLIAPRDEPRLDRARLEAAAARWRRATWLAPPGDAASLLDEPWSGMLASWITGGVGARDVGAVTPPR